MKIYKNIELTEEIKDNTFNLGKVTAGDTKRFTFYVYNETVALVKDLVFTKTHKEVSIIKAPETLKEKESKELILEWKPSITLKQGLKTSLHISGIELWE